MKSSRWIFANALATVAACFSTSCSQDNISPRAWVAHDDGIVTALATAFSPDGKVLASAGCNTKGSAGSLSQTMTVKLWDWRTGRLLRTLQSAVPQITKSSWQPFASVAFSPDSQTVASLDNDESVRFWNAQTGDLQYTQKDPAMADGYPHSAPTTIAFGPNGRVFAMGEWYGCVSLWDVKTKKLIHMGTPKEDGPVRSIVFSTDSSTLGGTTYTGVLKKWNATNAEEILSVKVGNLMTSTAFSPDGATLVSDGLGHLISRTHLTFLPDIAVWDAVTGAQRRTFPSGGKVAVKGLTYSPDGQLVAGYTYGWIMLWDAQHWRLKQKFKSRSVASRLSFSPSLAFSPDSKTLASGCSDGAIELWSIK